MRRSIFILAVVLFGLNNVEAKRCLLVTGELGNAIIWRIIDREQLSKVTVVVLGEDGIENLVIESLETLLESAKSEAQIDMCLLPNVVCAKLAIRGRKEIYHSGDIVIGLRTQRGENSRLQLLQARLSEEMNRSIGTFEGFVKRGELDGSVASFCEFLRLVLEERVGFTVSSVATVPVLGVAMFEATDENSSLDVIDTVGEYFKFLEK